MNASESSPRYSIRLGTRGSALALYQAEYTRALLQAARPQLGVEIVVIQSLGDKVRDRPLEALGAQGIFTQALEQALLEQRIDVAVHSAKDLPSQIDGSFVLAASPGREDPRDCLVTASGLSFAALPPQARLGTGSPRRAAQLRALRPDLQFVPIRGNVDTRRRAALEGTLDGVVLAAAGLKRLALFDDHVAPLTLTQCLPQAGQGILALETRAADGETIALLQAIHDPGSGRCLSAERAVLAGLAAGCQAPVAAHAELTEAHLQVRGLVAGDGVMLTALREGPVQDATLLGHAVAQDLLAQGAQQVLARVGATNA